MESWKTHPRSAVEVGVGGGAAGPAVEKPVGVLDWRRSNRIINKKIIIDVNKL